MRTPLLLALIATTTGCAHGKHLRSAAAHAEQGEWRDALADYEAAQARRPRSDRAAAGAEAVREQAVAEALADAARALDADEYEAAYGHVAWAQEEMPDAPEIAGAWRLIEGDMRDRLGAEIAAGRMDAAYDLAARTQALFPRSRGLDSELARIREHFVRAADGHAQKSRWTEALAALDVVYEHEPAQKSALAERESGFRAAWADDVAASARAAERSGDAGGSAALYGRAWEIAGRDTDRAAMRRQVDALRARGAWDVVVTSDGRHAMAFGDEIEAALGRASGVRTTSDRRAADLVIDLDAGGSTCEQHAVVRIADQPFVAGYRDVPNPTWDALMEELHRELAALDALEDRAAGLGRAVDHFRRAADLYAAEVLEPREAALQVALAKLGAAEAAAKDKRDEVTRLEAELARLEAEGGPPAARVHLAKRLEGARQALADLRLRVEAAHPAVVAATGARDEAKSAHDVKLAAVAEAAREHAAAERPVAEQAARVRALERRRQEVSPTVKQEIVDVFRYEVADWTRTCRTELEVAFSGAGGRDARRVGAERAVTDTTWGHFPEYRVTGDPLRFALSDAELFARADEAATPRLVDLVRERIAADREAEARRAVALATTDPEGATSAMLASYLAAPDLLGEGDRRAIARHLTARYGLDSLDTLSR